MENVYVEFLIEIRSNTHRNKYFFSDEWNFSISRYSFNKINEREIKVSFSFMAELKKIDEESNAQIDECPSEYLEEFQRYDEELETILDLLSLHSGAGIQIKEESYLFRSATCGDNEFNNKFPVKISDINDIFERTHDILKKDNDKLKTSLRLYRESLFFNDPRDRMPKLYSVLEQLFAKNNSKFLKAQEIDVIKKAFENIEIDEDKKIIILQRISDIRKSPKSMIIESLELSSDNGTLSNEEKIKLIGTWNKYRSEISHGKILQKRDEDLDIAVWEIDEIVGHILKKVSSFPTPTWNVGVKRKNLHLEFRREK